MCSRTTSVPRIIARAVTLTVRSTARQTQLIQVSQGLLYRIIERGQSRQKSHQNRFFQSQPSWNDKIYYNEIEYTDTYNPIGVHV